MTSSGWRRLGACALAGAAFLALTGEHAGVESGIPFVLARLALDVRVDYGQGTLGGTATLTLRNGSDLAAGTIPLLLGRLMRVAAVSGAAGEPLPFTQQVVVFDDDSVRQVNAVAVQLPAPVAPGDSVVVAVRYAGTLVGYAETGSLYIKDHVSRAFTILRSDALAFPELGAPSWTVLRTVRREPFAFAARVTVPPALTVAMGGEGTADTGSDSLVTWTYRSVLPVPFLNITIAPYRVLHHAGTRIFYFPADSAGARMVARAIASAVARYRAWFGEPGADLRLTVIEIPEGYGSQASLAAGILQTADAFRRRSALPQLYHELSHVWNVRDLDRPSPRWNEGLAMFLQWRMAAELDGWSHWSARLARTVGDLRGACAAPVRCDSVPFAAYGRAGLTDLSYSTGMLMFYALYRVMGPVAFDRVYRDFFQRHRESGAPGDSLAAEFGRASPAARAVLEEWYITTMWYGRLAGGESLDRMVAGYRRRGVAASLGHD